MMRSAPAASRQRLGALLIRRRIEMDPRYRKRTVFAQERGLHWRLLYDIEKARRDTFSDETIAAVEAAYQWQEGSVARVLDGGDPEAARAEGEPARERSAQFADPALQRLWEVPDLSDAEKQQAIAAVLDLREKMARAGFTEEDQRLLRYAPAAFAELVRREQERTRDHADDGHAPGQSA